MMKKFGETGKHKSEFNNIHRYNVNYFDTDIDNPETKVGYIDIEEPRICAHCNNTGTQVKIDIIIVSGKKSKYDAVAVYACQLCKESTINFFNFQLAWYNDSEDYETKQISILTVTDQLPQNTFNLDIPEIIQVKYTSFSEIFNQSKIAEDNGLNHLAGMGYRKSIEFLVTDFLKDYSDDKTVTSDWLDNPGTTLKEKINKLPTDRLKRTANAITYIGNDEAHYTVRNPHYNIHDMKKFIALLIKEIESELIYDEVEDFLG